MELRCQQIVLGHQCKQPVYKNEMYCRWHKILREFRRDNQLLPEMFPAMGQGTIASGHMYGSGTAMFAFLFCLSLFDKTNNILWLPVAFLSLGWSFTFGADGIMARGDDYPLSLFVIWPKLLMIGLFLSVITSVLVVADVLVVPSNAALLLQQVTNSHTFDTAAIYIVVFGLSISILFNGRLLTKRVLFLNTSSSVAPHVNTEVIKPAPLGKRDPLKSGYTILQEYRDGFIQYCQRQDAGKQMAYRTRLNGSLGGEIVDLYFDNKGYLFEFEAGEEILQRAIRLSRHFPIYIMTYEASWEMVERIKELKKTRRVYLYRLLDMGRTSTRLSEGSAFESYTWTIPQPLWNL